MDALIFLVVFFGMTLGLWSLGAKGLAVALALCGVAVGAVEGWYYFGRKHDTISKEVGRLHGQARWKFYVVLALLMAGATGLVLHLHAMAR